MIFKALKTRIIFASILTLTSGVASALTDQEALSEGMMPLEDYVINEMKAVTTPGLNSEGVERAVRLHRVVIAVNKATKGPEAQTLRLFENGIEVLREKISTGREKEEKAKSGRTYFSTTPKGFFRPTKIYRDYMSYTWQAPMPNAVFFVGGIAVHATGKSHYSELGSRASGGCVRTKLEVSQLIREKIMDSGRGSSSGHYKISKESEGRNRITNNHVVVDQVDRKTGDFLNGKINSWDTVIIVYE
jgi:hypothetical protein